jgi:ribosome-interacting GTPase 1
MPANLTPDYLAAEQAYKHATTPQEKIAALEDMLALLPKHKGTEKMQADIRHRLSQTRKESQKKGTVHSTPAYIIHREGAGQIALVGPPNSGKSQLVCALTHARPEVADYPFTTHMPVAGMMQFEDVKVQLVDLPAISSEFLEAWMPQALRVANVAALVVDPNDADVLGEIEFILGSFAAWRLAAPQLLVSNKSDLPGAAENAAVISEMYCDRMRCLSVSAIAGLGLEDFARAAFESLNVVRFYSKPPGKKPDLDVPYTLQRGQTVQEAAAKVHRDFVEHLQFARLFRPGHEHDGLMVERTHKVEDRDILEFHAY